MNKMISLGLGFAAVLFSSVCIAGNQGPVSVSSFHSVANVNATVSVVETCTGVDGTYNLLSVKGSGPITSNDPRMEGVMNVDALILDSPTTSLGASVDHWTVVDSADPTLVKAQGKAVATDLGPNPKAVVYGFLADGSVLVTNTVVTLGPTVVIEYGGAGLNVPDRGVIFSGNNKCVKKLVKSMQDRVEPVE